MASATPFWVPPLLVGADAYIGPPFRDDTGPQRADVGIGPYEKRLDDGSRDTSPRCPHIPTSAAVRSDEHGWYTDVVGGNIFPPYEGMSETIGASVGGDAHISPVSRDDTGPRRADVGIGPYEKGWMMGVGTPLRGVRTFLLPHDVRIKCSKIIQKAPLDLFSTLCYSVLSTQGK